MDNPRWEMIKEKVLEKHKRDAEVYERDGRVCRWCGLSDPKAEYEIDHIHPKSKGGSNDLDNLTVACKRCNRKKTNLIYMPIREPELEIAARIGITPEAYKILRRLKVERKKSMVRIVSELILNETALPQQLESTND